MNARVAEQLTRVAIAEKSQADVGQVDRQLVQYLEHVDELVAERVFKIQRGIAHAVSKGTFACDVFTSYDLSEDAYRFVEHREFVLETAQAVDILATELLRDDGYRVARVANDPPVEAPVPQRYTSRMVVNWSGKGTSKE